MWRTSAAGTRSGSSDAMQFASRARASTTAGVARYGYPLGDAGHDDGWQSRRLVGGVGRLGGEDRTSLHPSRAAAALACLRGLLLPLERKNGWRLAEAAGN